MKSNLRVLIVEDSESDAALVSRELSKADYEVESQRVDTADSLRQALSGEAWDLIIADYALPGFDAAAALAIAHDSGKDIPFIVFSGQIGEGRAVDLMRAGAHDYVLKNNPTRLVPAVARELKEAAVRRQRRLAESALRDSEARYRAIVESNAVMICRFLPDGRLTFVNTTYCEYFGKKRRELIGFAFTPLVPEEDLPMLDQMMGQLQSSTKPFTHEHRVYNGRGEIRWNEWTNSPILNEQGCVQEYQAVGRDITEAKHAADQLQRLTSETLRMQDEERRRLARELHDTTAQKLSAISLNLNYVKSHAAGLTDKSAAALNDALSLTESCTREIRTLSYLLHPPELDLLGLKGAIADFLHGFGRRSGIEVQFQVPPDFERLPQEIETALFRIVQESLTNVHRHSCSPTASVRLDKHQDRVCIEIQDTGQGMLHPSENSETETFPGVGRMGVGLAGMRERLKRLRGDLQIRSSPHGTSVIGWVPL